MLLLSSQYRLKYFVNVLKSFFCDVYEEKEIFWYSEKPARLYTTHDGFLLPGSLFTECNSHYTLQTKYIKSNLTNGRQPEHFFCIIIMQ